MNRLRVAALTPALLLLAAPAALARSGSGSSGFGGGGGRGFSGIGRGFGHGRFFFIPIGGGGGGLLLIILVAVIVFVVLPRLVMWWRSFSQGRQSSGPAERRRVRQRERRVELAAAEASEDDPVFAPDVVKPAAEELFLAVQAAWDAADRVRLRGLVAPGLLAEWERRLDDMERRGWRNRVQPVGTPRVDYVGLRHTGDGEDRVTVRIEATLRDYVEDAWGQHIRRVDALSETSRVREYWTLGQRDTHWILLSIEQGAEGAHALSEEVVASPWADERRMRDEALVEGAVAEAVPAGTNLAELADLEFTGDARAAANDLSLADGRFAPDVLEVAARRVVQAWVEAVDGSDARLERVADPEAVSALLHPDGPRTRLVVRGLEIRQIRITGLDAAAAPPAMKLELELNGRRYLEDRDTAAVLAGNQARAARFSEHWTLRLSGDDGEPWRLASVGGPLARR
jgi:predicted lipid-binding transport protein (Tim44 family)